jgi:hypothetical protein
MKKWYLLIPVALFVGIYFYFRKTSENPGVTLDFPKITFEDYATFASPRAGQGTGYVFRIANNAPGKLIPVGPLYFKWDTISTQLVDCRQRWNNNVVFNFLGLDVVQGGSSAANAVDVTLKFGSAVIESPGERTLDSLLKVSDIDFKPESRYFIIASAVSVRSISYTSNGDDQFDSHISEAVGKIKDTAKVSIHSTNEHELVQRFNKPYYLLYKLEEFDTRGIKLADDDHFQFKKTTVKITR